MTTVDKNSSMVVLNGQVVSAVSASVPIDDRGFLYGESIFTTVRCYGGMPFKLDRHCSRLNASLRSTVIDIDHQVDLAVLEKDIQTLVELNRCPDAVARFMVTRGCGSGPLCPSHDTPTTLLTVNPYTPVPALYRQGVKLVVSSIRRDPDGVLGRHKLGSYVPSLLARREAHDEGAYEAIIRDTDGNFLECACSNLFAVVDGVVITPDITENLLPGVTRETVLQCASDLALSVELATLTESLLGRAEEMFITNSVIELAPVSKLVDMVLSAPGPVTTALMAAYREKVTLA